MSTISTESILSSLEHDLKSPLVGILSVCALLKFLPPDKITKKVLDESVSKIEKKAYASLELIEDLSRFSHIPQEKGAKDEVINLSHSIQEAQKKYKNELVVNMPSGLTIKGKKEYVTKAINLLIQQAIGNDFRNGAVTLTIVKKTALKLSYSVIGETNGISQDIDSGKEKLYHYYLLALLNICKGSMQIAGKKEGIDVLVTL